MEACTRDQMQTPSFNAHISCFYLLTSFPATPAHISTFQSNQWMCWSHSLPELSQVSATRLTHSIQPVIRSSTAYSRKPPQLALFCVSVTGWASSLSQSREPYPSPRVSWCASCLDTYLHHETMNSLSVETLVILSLFPSSGPPCFFNSRQANIYAKINTAAFKWNPAFFFWPRHTAYGILVSRPETEPFPSAVEAQGSSHWTTREFLETRLFKKPCKPPHNYSLLCHDYKENWT